MRLKPQSHFQKQPVNVRSMVFEAKIEFFPLTVSCSLADVLSNFNFFSSAHQICDYQAKL